MAAIVKLFTIGFSASCSICQIAEGRIPIVNHCPIKTRYIAGSGIHYIGQGVGAAGYGGLVFRVSAGFLGRWLAA